MLFLRNTTARRVPVASRSFVTSVRSQSQGSHMNDNDPDTIEREKKKNLSGGDHSSSPHKSHAPGWSEALASVSEAFVKADQAPVESPEELTRTTIEYVKKQHHSNAHADDYSSSQTASLVSTVTGEGSHERASYEREELEGPLAGKTSTIERDEVRGPLKSAGKR